jgi:hypothetical protein
MLAAFLAWHLLPPALALSLLEAGGPAPLGGSASIPGIPRSSGTAAAAAAARAAAMAVAYLKAGLQAVASYALAGVTHDRLAPLLRGCFFVALAGPLGG